MNYEIKFVEYDSPEYQAAAQLRYRLFYQEHSISFASIFNSQEKEYLHLAITANRDNQVVAYGRLECINDYEFQISQMVVEPQYQRQGLGTLILEKLSTIAVDKGASTLVLNARVTKILFYQNCGFETVGEVFASSTTGVSHIKMQKSL